MRSTLTSKKKKKKAAALGKNISIYEIYEINFMDACNWKITEFFIETYILLKIVIFIGNSNVSSVFLL